MRKIILKTALITLSAMLAAFFIFAAVISFAFPVVAGKACSDIGLHSASAKYYVRAYRNTGEYTYIADVLKEATLADDNALISEYGYKFITSPKFSDYCAARGDDGDFTTADYYACITVQSTYYVGEKATAAQIAFDFTEVYSRKCPLWIAIITALDNSDKDFAGIIKTLYDKSDIKTEDIKLLDELSQ